jgi:hypothetical protein
MPEGKRNRIRLMILIGVSVIFVATGYFRFFHKKGAATAVPPPASARPAVTAAAPEPVVAPVDLKQLLQSPAGREQAAEPVRSAIRDIFAPQRLDLRGGVSSVLQTAASGAGFVLGGTIVGGGKPLAIINDQFLGIGSQIGGYRVKNITKKGVTLQSDHDQIEIPVLSDMERKMPDSSR